MIRQLKLLVFFLHTMIFASKCSTVLPLMGPCKEISTFTIVHANTIGGTAYAEGSETTSTVTFPTGVAYTTPPKVTVGMIRYEGIDIFYLASVNLLDMFFTFFQEGSTTGTSFNLKHEIKSAVWAVTYRVIALDSAFPDHLNLISNVNIFGSSTVTTGSTQSVTKSYSSMVGSVLFNTFTPVNGTDYSYTKIVSFLSCFGYKAHAGTTPYVQLSYTILSSTNVRFDMSIGTVVDVDRMHWNLIVLDLAQLQNSGRYIVYFGSSTFTSALGGTIPTLQPY